MQRLKELKELLDQKVDQYNSLQFIDSDPISIPHSFEKKEDIEISAFLTAIISWGNRKSIITNAEKMMLLFDRSPHDFIMNHTSKDLKNLGGFVHRTFNSDDLMTFVQCLAHLYRNQDGLEGAFSLEKDLEKALSIFPSAFFYTETPKRSHKHVAKIEKGSAAKRINMFLRWMVRKDDRGVDFGIWNKLNSSSLYLPLDVHSAGVARKLGLLERKQNDWKAVKEVTDNLRSMDARDPVKYDFALFGMGVFEKLT